MRGKTALIGFLVLQVVVVGIWVMSLVPVLGSGAAFISPEAHIWSGGVYSSEVDNFRMRSSALSATPFKVYEYLLWSTLLMVASAAAGWFASGAFQKARPWLSAGLSVVALGLAAGAAYYIVEQWSGDTLFPPGSVNDQALYMATRAFMIQLFIGWVLLAIYTVLTIAGLATADKPLGYHLVALNWLIVAVVWTLTYLALYLAPTFFAGA
jgi:heme/copper-type cytochrome/quinol oxidase subunit 3